MVQTLDQLKESPSQTAGPYVHIGTVPNRLGIHGIYPEDLGLSPIREGAKGERITITGTVRDGAGMILRDVLLESWQPDAAGRFPGHHADADPGVTGFARFIGDFDSGEWQLATVKPGRVPTATGALMAPHISLWIVARGVNIGLQTRIYFSDEDAANAACPVLGAIENRPRVQTLIAKQTGPGAYRFDVVLQGEDETVFFDI